jgi:fused signal recognition particle receptor
LLILANRITIEAIQTFCIVILFVSIANIKYVRIDADLKLLKIRKIGNKMFGFIKRKKKDTNEIEAQPIESIIETPEDESSEMSNELSNESDVAENTTDAVVDSIEKPQKKSFFDRIKLGLGKTRKGLSDGIANLFLGKKEINDDLLEELEMHLLMADVGVEATTEIIQNLTERVSRKELADGDAVYHALKTLLKEMADPVSKPLIVENEKGPYVILMVGINGVGKTTTIGKLAKKFQQEGKSVMLAAGDTFRAAAVEQLQVWGQRNDVPVVAQHTGADSASVLFDALEAAKARDVDVLIADTAGRLHTKDNLMGELEKVVRVMKKIDADAPHEVMLVLDAATGQNAINQTEQFLKCVNVSGLTLTKLDGTAKGGILFALAKKFNIPMRFIGVGEGIDDLRPFDSAEFIEALFSDEKA